MHRNKSQDFQNNMFWTDKTKIEMFGHSTTFNENQTQHINYQHSDGGLKLGPKGAVQVDNDPKNTSKSESNRVTAVSGPNPTR